MPIGNLSVGAFGDEVRTVHNDLRQQGYDLPAAEIDRQFFGPETRDAITRFQRERNLKVTGIVDVATGAALRASATRPIPANSVERPKAVAVSLQGAGTQGTSTQVASTSAYSAPPTHNGAAARQTSIANNKAHSTGRATDYSARDSEAKVSFYVLLWKRRGITLTSFDDYWRDVHGPVCARLPGQFQYWQFHVAHNEGGVFPNVAGVTYSTNEEDQFDGIAELTFRSVTDRQVWFDAAGILMDDEHNIFSKAIGYVTEQGNSKTYVDGIDVGDPNGNLNVIKFHVMVRQAPRTTVADFRRYLKEIFAANVVRNANVLKFRLHLFEPPDVSRPDAAGVVHIEPPDRQYQAAFEIAFKDKLTMETFFASPEYAAAIGEQAKYVQQVSPFPERDPYTFVYDGQMTLAGQRGSMTAGLITTLGATNQIRADIQKLMVGKVIQEKAPANQQQGRTPASAKGGSKPNITQIFSSYQRESA